MIIIEVRNEERCINLHKYGLVKEGRQEEIKRQRVFKISYHSYISIDIINYAFGYSCGIAGNIVNLVDNLSCIRSNVYVYKNDVKDMSTATYINVVNFRNDDIYRCSNNLICIHR